MKGFYLRYIGPRRNAGAIGLINLIYNLARSEQIIRLKAAATERRLKNELKPETTECQTTTNNQSSNIRQ